MTPSEFEEPTSFDPNAQDTSGKLIGGVVSMLVGSALLLGGLILYAGERAERLVIFPGAGRLTLLLGIVAFALGAALAGRRAALMLGGLMVVGGITVYALAIAFIEPPRNRPYQAIGLLTVLVGLITIYATYRVDGAMEANGPIKPGKGKPA